MSCYIGKCIRIMGSSVSCLLLTLVDAIGLDKEKNQRKILNKFLPIIFNISFGCSKKMSH